MPPGAPGLDSETWVGTTSETKAPIKRLNPIKLKHLEDRLAEVERDLPNVESRIVSAEQRLGNFTSAEDSQRTATELDHLRTRHATLLTEWEELTNALEEQSSAV